MSRSAPVSLEQDATQGSIGMVFQITGAWVNWAVIVCGVINSLSFATHCFEQFWRSCQRGGLYQNWDVWSRNTDETWRTKDRGWTPSVLLHEINTERQLACAWWYIYVKSWQPCTRKDCFFIIIIILERQSTPIESTPMGLSIPVPSFKNTTMLMLLGRGRGSGPVRNGRRSLRGLSKTSLVISATAVPVLLFLGSLLCQAVHVCLCVYVCVEVRWIVLVCSKAPAPLPSFFVPSPRLSLRGILCSV